MKKAPVISIIFAVIIGGIIGFYALYLASDESLYFRRNSFAYYLFIDSFIENVPRVSVEGEPLYYNSAGDGPKQPATGISYRSRAAPAEIYNLTHQYLTAGGYRLIPNEPPRVEDFANGTSLAGYAYESRIAFVYLYIRREPDGSSSHLMLTRNF